MHLCSEEALSKAFVSGAYAALGVAAAASPTQYRQLRRDLAATCRS